MEQVAKILGVELNEEFNIEDSDYKYKITKDGMKVYYGINDCWNSVNYTLGDILSGKREIKKSILDEVEKEYLSNVIKPFRNQVLNICKYNIILCEYMYEQIRIQVRDGHDNGYTTIRLPIFKKDTMYKGMKADKAYSLNELGL